MYKLIECVIPLKCQKLFEILAYQDGSAWSAAKTKGPDAGMNYDTLAIGF